jgi:hypothetical protein
MDAKQEMETGVQRIIKRVQRVHRVQMRRMNPMDAEGSSLKGMMNPLFRATGGSTLKPVRQP